MDRYHRQTLLRQIGPAGQQRLGRSRVLLVGCGALGSMIAQQLTRAGVGTLILADRDLVEMTNLQRQVLFDEAAAKQALPKAVAAAEHLRAINSSVNVDARVADVHSGNIEQLAGVDRHGTPVDLILDGTDNVQTRYLLNDVAVKHGVPWVYGGCVGTEGRVMTIRPGKTPCLRCVFGTPPRPQDLETCDTAGVLGPAAGAIACWQSIAAIKLLVGATDAIANELLAIDFWNNRIRAVSLEDARREDCACCGQRRFEFLDTPRDASATSLCGRNAIQIRPAEARQVDLGEVAERLGPLGEVERTAYLIRCALRDSPGVSVTLFGDGRMIVHGTHDVGRAKSIYARLMGL